MATEVNFHGKNYIEPGSYAATVYNPTSVVNVAEFGNVMIIDTGLSINGTYEFAGGAGVKGELSQGLKSVYEFTNYEDFLAFMGGGLVGDIAKKIFTPMEGAAGAPKLYYVRAATTTCATITLTFSTGNALVMKCKNEGIVGNGVSTSGVLRVGYGAKVVAGSVEGTFKMQVYRGSFMGVDEDGESFGAKSISDSTPNLIAESPDLDTLQELYDWASSNKQILSNFVVSKTGEGSTELSELALVLATGGATTYLSGTEYDDVLEAIAEPSKTPVAARVAERVLTLPRMVSCSRS